MFPVLGSEVRGGGVLSNWGLSRQQWKQGTVVAVSCAGQTVSGVIVWVVGLSHWWYQKQSSRPPQFLKSPLTSGGSEGGGWGATGLRLPDRGLSPVCVYVGVDQWGNSPVFLFGPGTRRPH